MGQEVIKDSYGRPLEYMRLAVTDRCNLRCFYCMPPEGIDFVPRSDLLTYEDMLRLARIMVSLGVNKIRLTGGEPFIRKNFYGFLKRLSQVEGLEKIAITTNGAVANKHIPFLKEIGITSLNLSLDTLDRQKFQQITRRDFFDQAMSTYRAALDAGMKLNVNMVTMSGINEEDILPMAMLTKDDPVTVRFIEEMPFNGTGEREIKSTLTYKEIVEILQSGLPKMTELARDTGSTSNKFSIAGHKGKVGVIAAWSRTFCNDCNRIRVTAKGEMKNCLYDHGILDLKRLLNDGSSDEMIRDAIRQGYSKKFKNGHEAEANRDQKVTESMSTIGG